MPRRKTNLKEEVSLKNKKTDLKVKVTKTRISRLTTKVKKTEPKKKGNAAIVVRKTEGQDQNYNNLSEMLASSDALLQNITAQANKTAQPLANKPGPMSSGQIIRQQSYDPEERQKKLIMWTGVTFFMLLFVGFWLFNLKTIFKVDNSVANNNPSLAEITNNLTKTMSEVSSSLDKLNNVATSTVTSTEASAAGLDLASSTASTSPLQVIATTTTSTINDKQAELEALKAKLEQLQKQLATSTNNAKLPAN